MSIENILCINDIHAGNKKSISVPDIELNEGESEHPTQFQLGLLKIFESQLDKVFDELKGEKFAMIIGGEIIDGNSPKNVFSKKLISDQARIAGAVLSKVTDRCDKGQLDRTYLLEGTEWHSGLGNDFDKLFADGLINSPLKLRKNKKHSHTWQEVLIEFPNGAELHGTHHFNATNIYESTAYVREWKETCFDCQRHGYKHPEILYRCHIHRWGYFNLDMHPLTKIGVFTLPGWKGLEQYPMKGLARLKPVSQHGMGLLQQIDGKVELKPFLDTIKPYSNIREKL